MSTDMLRYIYDSFAHVDGQQIADLENWAAVTMGFFFLLRASEIRSMRHRDILLGVDNGRAFVTLFIRKSNTDQAKRGTFRTLYGVPSVLCPVKAVATFITAKRRNGETTTTFFF